MWLGKKHLSQALAFSLLLSLELTGDTQSCPSPALPTGSTQVSLPAVRPPWLQATDRLGATSSGLPLCSQKCFHPVTRWACSSQSCRACCWTPSGQDRGITMAGCAVTLFQQEHGQGAGARTSPRLAAPSPRPSAALMLRPSPRRHLHRPPLCHE